MKKMTKVLALLTVMAMLATLFVAAPASASIEDDIMNCTATVDLHFTSGNTPDSTQVDPNTLSVGDVFYVWVDYSGFVPGVYVMSDYNFLAYDKTVEVPYNLTGKKAATSTATAKRGFVWADLPQYSEDDMNGFYQNSTNANLDEGWLYADVTIAADLQTIINGGDHNTLEDYTEDVLYSVPNSGSFVAFGWAFIKTADGPSGITIAGNNKVLNGKDVWYPVTQLPDAATISLTTMPTTYRKVDGATVTSYTYIGGGTAAGAFIDNSPVDSAATEEPTEVPVTEAPTDEPTEVPVTEAPTEAPTDVPEAQGEVSGAKQASNSVSAPNAFFYEFTTPVIPGEVTGLTATFQIDGKDVANGSVTNVNLTGISNIALKIAAIVKNIPEANAATPVTTNYTLNYSVAGVAKTLVWSRTDSLN